MHWVQTYGFSSNCYLPSLINRAIFNRMNKKILWASRIENFLLKQNLVLIRTPLLLERPRKFDLSYRGWDYVRTSSLELCAAEIYDNGIEGSIAEVGVYKGEFAKSISRAFPDRKFYLYDTFEGFSSKDIEHEKKIGIENSTHEIDFSDTSVEAVLAGIPNNKNCIIRKGYFPDTVAEENQEKFVFVSLDADLYKPIYDGLEFFYPRMQKGGYIFIHDFNNNKFSGAKAAVKKFCSENRIAFVPLTDIAGTAVIGKS